jgi:hypothetical protein
MCTLFSTCPDRGRAPPGKDVDECLQPENPPHGGKTSMKVYRLAMRRSIMALMVDRLRDCFNIELPGGIRSIDGFSSHEISSLLSLGSDPKLEELSSALARLEKGTFGKCTGCKTWIGWSLLLRDPARRVCPECEHQPGSHAHEFSESAGPAFIRASPREILDLP